MITDIAAPPARFKKQDDVDKVSTVEQALHAAAPHALLDVVTAALAEQYGAEQVELRMVDYGMRSLQTVDPEPRGAEPVPIQGSPQGRAFGSQEPCVTRHPRHDAVTVHLPMTIRGDRMGVLSVRLPAEHDARPQISRRQAVCSALGREILVAERDTDLYLLARRATRLTLAAKMRWQSLPGHSCARPEFSLGAHLEPAYAIFGDNFDWSVSADHLTLVLTNGMGEGIEASLLTNLAINALRNARRAGLDLCDQASLADQAVYAHYRGACYLSALLPQFDFATGEAEVVDAGRHGCGVGGRARWSPCASTHSCRSGCSRTPSMSASTSPPDPAIASCSGATGYTKRCPRPARATGNGRWPAPWATPGYCRRPRCPRRSCISSPASAPRARSTTTPWWSASTGTGGRSGADRAKGARRKGISRGSLPFDNCARLTTI